MLPTARPRLLMLRGGPGTDANEPCLGGQTGVLSPPSRQAGDGPRLSPEEVLNEVMRLSVTQSQASMRTGAHLGRYR